MKAIFSFFVFLFLALSSAIKAQNSILNQGVYFPMNGNTIGGFYIDDYCNSYTAPNYLPCNRGTTNESGVANAAYLFPNWNADFLGARPGNYFYDIYIPYTINQNADDFNNGLTVSFSFKLTGNSYQKGGVVMDATYETYPGSPNSGRKGFMVSVDESGVRFDCYFNDGSSMTATSSGVSQVISPFVPDTGVWYHATCVLSHDRTSTPGITSLRIYVNNMFKGEFLSVYNPSGISPKQFVSIGAKLRPNNAFYNPDAASNYSFYPLYDNSKPYNPVLNNPVLSKNQFAGALDEIRYYNIALDYDQRTEVYNARLNSPVPSITSYTPSTAKAGNNITITGDNFTSINEVQINGVSADSITIASDEMLYAKVPNPTNSIDSTVLIRSVRVINSDGNAIRYGTITTTSNNTPAPPRPGIIIAGPASACGLAGLDSSFTYRITDTVSSTYLWRVSTSNIIVLSALNTDSLKIKFKPAFTSGVIYVKRMRPNDTANISLVVTNTVPSRTSAISGNRNVCNFTGTAAGTPTRYTVRRAVGASEYVWTLPSGASVDGVSGGSATYTSSDTAINLVFTSGFTSGTLMVRSQNACGISTDQSLLLTATNAVIPGAITGSLDVCSSMISDSLPTGSPVTYRVRRNATYSGYSWSVPAHVTIIDFPGGQGTSTDTAITVLFDSTFVSGNISVRGVTPCYTTNPRNLAVTRRLPSYRLITVASSSLTCPSRSIQYQSSPITYARWYEWSVPSNASIEGRRDTTSINVNYTAAASQTGDVVRLRGVNNCGKGNWTSIPVRLTACPSSFAKTDFTRINKPNLFFEVNVFPNPTRNAFNVNLKSISDLPVYIRVTDVSGKLIEQKLIKRSNSLELGQSYPAGIYIIQCKQGSESKMIKAIKN